MKEYKLIEIGGDACANCHAMIYELNEVAQKTGLEFVRVDIERNPELIEKYHIEKIPTVILADGEYIIAKCSGFQPQEILELWIEAKLEDYKRGTK